MKLKSIFIPLFLLLILPLLIIASKKIIDSRKSAASIPANIVIDTDNRGIRLTSSLWRNFSQGGEEPTDMIKPAIKEIKPLSPELIRLDHLFDYYQVDQGNGKYDFSRLDSAVDSILATGAKPMLSLSYTPDTKEPSDWNQWYQLIRATARHYSVDKKISGIYYEVWNEPDLFGGWHYSKNPNYLTLYQHTARAVIDGATGTNFKIGGPATTGYYGNWIKALFKYCAENNLRLDFISWHRYSKDTADYLSDFDNLNSILSDYPQYFDIERLITEIGPNPEPDHWYETTDSGVHLASLITHLSGKIHRLFSFEIVDGPTPRSDQSTGWGIIGHDLKIKPRYHIFSFLNQLNGQLLDTAGNGSFVSALAVNNGTKIQVLLSNYDPKASHSETFPMTFKGITPGDHTITVRRYLGATTTKKITTNSPTYTETIYMEPNTALIFEINN